MNLTDTIFDIIVSQIHYIERERIDGFRAEVDGIVLGLNVYNLIMGGDQNADI